MKNNQPVSLLAPPEKSADHFPASPDPSPVKASVPDPGKLRKGVITGYRAGIIHGLIWLHIIGICLACTRSLKKTIEAFRTLKSRYRKFRNKGYVIKYARIRGRYQFNLNTPAWPSAAFNQYIRLMLQKAELNNPVAIQTLVLAITKKCGFQCAHCVEWNQLNQPERLTRHDLLNIISKFKKLGISQLQLSGGEPLSRFKDILFLLRKASQGLDIWTYTNGYALSREKCEKLRDAGLTGVIVSIDHHVAAVHDQFRGKPGAWEHAIAAVHHAREAGLGVAISCCVTREYCTLDNLQALSQMAQTHGAMFLQLMEPRAEGHFANKDVLLQPQHILTLEAFYDTMMHSPAGNNYPIITYHAYQTRRQGCLGAGREFLYVDTDGMVQSCPFCREKWFSALQEDIRPSLQALRLIGCVK